MQKDGIIFRFFFHLHFLHWTVRSIMHSSSWVLSICFSTPRLLTHNLIDCPRWTSTPETWFCANRLMTTEVVFNYKISRLLLSIIHQSSHVFLKHEQAVVHLQGIEHHFFPLSKKSEFRIQKRKTYRWYATARVFEWISHKNDLEEPSRSSSSTTYL